MPDPSRVRPEPLALLHGFTGSPRSWDRVATELFGTTAVFAPPLSGHGHPAAELTVFEDEVDRIASELAARAPSWGIVGYSLGGRVALGLLVRHPGLFENAVLIGAQPGLESEVERAERSKADLELCRILTEHGIAAFVSRWESAPLFASQANLPTSVLAAQRAERLRHDPLELSRSLRTTGLSVMPAYWADLPKLRAPVHLVVGEHDAKFRSIAQRMQGLIPHATLTVVPGVGHNVVLEAPDEVTRAVARAIRESP